MKYINIAKFSFFVVFCTIRKNRVPYTYKKSKKHDFLPSISQGYYQIFQNLKYFMTINDH